MRATNGPVTRRKRKAVKRELEGSWGTKHTSYKIARQQLLKNAKFALRDRRAKKRDFRRLWNNRINVSVRALSPEYNYSTFINALLKKNIRINRVMLSELSISQPDQFKTLVELAYSK